LPVAGFADADYASRKDTLRSTTGQLFCMNGAAFSWDSALEPTVAWSTVEAEYMCRAATSWPLQQHARRHCGNVNLRRDIQLRTEGTTQLWGDNQGTLALEDPGLHARTKHIALHHHPVREHIARRRCV
jgi:hypothetical protein